jgi:serine/threonine-protein kinase
MYMEDPTIVGYNPGTAKQPDTANRDEETADWGGRPHEIPADKSGGSTYGKSGDSIYGKSGVTVDHGSGEITADKSGGAKDDDKNKRAAAPGDGGKAAQDKEGLDDAEAKAILGQRFRFVKSLGKGGQGSVYLVEDTTMGDLVAVKIFPPHFGRDRRYIEQIRNEVRIPRSLRHPLIAAIHDLVELENGRLGISMEYIEGCNLREWMNNEGADRWNRAGDYLVILRRLAQALQVAHEAKVVHRDIKPQNVMLRNGLFDRPVLLDFGLALPDESSPDGIVGGTCSYMAPEQYERPGEVDYRADLFALGVIAYQLYTGQLPPCSLKDVRKTRKAPNIPVRDIPSVCGFNPRVPAALDQIIKSLLSFVPGERPGSAAEVAARLEGVEIIAAMESPAASQAKQGDAPDAALRCVEAPAGDFHIGFAGTGAAECERPRKRIFLDGFKISVFTVTNAVYRRFVEATGHRMPRWADDGVFGRDDHPVVGVTWQEALECCKWLGGMLPTEAQWERAAKGLDGRLYPWGGVFETERANVDFYQNSTTPVGSFPKGISPCGCFDMAGNVREWCMDWYDAQAYKRMDDGCKNPMITAAAVGREKVLRGGGFGSIRYEARCTFRGHLPPDAGEQDVGFRVVYA